MEWLGTGGQGSREGVPLYLFILIFCTVEEEGAEVEVFFLPSLDICKEDGKGGQFFFMGLMLRSYV